MNMLKINFPGSRGIANRGKSLDDIFDAPEFWNEQRDLMLKAVVPVFRAAFIAGAQAGAVQTAMAVKADEDAPPPTFDMAAINGAADAYIAGYASDWWQSLEGATQTRIRDAVTTARAEGHGPRWVAEQIVDLFGAARAKVIAVTEMTTLMGAGAQAQYKLDGYTAWEWRTANDSRVCPVCGPRNEQQFKMDEPFAAAHPNCRCWPVPAGDRATVPSSEARSLTAAEFEAKHPTVKVDFPGSDPAMVGPHLAEIDRLLEKYPETEKHLTYVGTRGEKVGSEVAHVEVRPQDQRRKGKIGTPLKPGDLHTMGLGIVYKPVYLAPVAHERYRLSMFDSSTVATENVQATTHEFGHVIDHVLRQRGIGLVGDRVALPGFTGVSPYGATRDSEGFAEAFSASEHGLAPGHPDIAVAQRYADKLK